MSETTIEAVDAWEVLDSRGNPTVRVCVQTTGGSGTFTVPSGASTGRHEALERRDGDERYGGNGVRQAVTAVTDDLSSVVRGRDAGDQSAIDAALTEADGTADLSHYGANAILGVSGAVARAASNALNVPLYERFETSANRSIPLPMVNILSGGLHAVGGIDIQDLLVIPAGVGSYPEALERVWQVRDAVRVILREDGQRTLVADEGGFAPPLDDIHDAFSLLTDGVRRAGLVPGDDVHFGVDVAASHFYDTDRSVYRLESVDRPLDSGEMVEWVRDWADRWPVISIEDPLAEDDWAAWADLTARIGDDVQIIGDDLIVTNRDRMTRALETSAANAVLVKPNQAGTLSRAIDVTSEALAAGISPVISARSGETCDTSIADLAVALGAGQIKIGSLARSERTAKYNRLLAIDRESGYELAHPERIVS